MGAYSDIRDHPRHAVDVKRRASLLSRAVQFAPFDALTGFEDELDETRTALRDLRLKDCLDAMAEDDRAELNAAFQKLTAAAASQPLVSVTYFRRRTKKGGGAYAEHTAKFRFYDAERRMLCFADRAEIPADAVTEIRFLSDEV